MKLLHPKDRILLALGLLGDIWDEARLLGGAVPANYRQLYGWVPPQYQRANLYQAVYRLLKTGELEKVVVNGEPCFQLTSASGKKLIRRFSIFKLQAQPWKKIWTVGVYDVEEIVRWERKWLMGRFLSLGFGRLQRSVYISPYDVGEDLKEMIVAKGLEKKVEIFTQASLAGGHEKVLAWKVWPIEELSQEYKKIVADCLGISKLPGRKRKEKIQKTRSCYLDLLLKDPHLPFELLPEDWQEKETRKLIKSLS